MNQNIRSDLTEYGVLIARIDMPGRTMNVFSVDMMDSLEHLLRRVESDEAVRAVVLTSAKQAFLAGAYLDMIRTFTERARTDVSGACSVVWNSAPSPSSRRSMAWRSVVDSKFVWPATRALWRTRRISLWGCPK